MKIGVFDSGLGGVTILKAFAKILPNYDYQYYGDTANLPYGDKTEEEIYNLAKDASDWLFKADCLIIVFACNTASADTLRKLQDQWLPENYPDRKLLGVIIPTIEYLSDTGPQNVLMLATKRTVESEKYEREIKRCGDLNLRVLSVATPELVPLIEGGKIDEAISQAVRKIRAVARVGEFDTILLGCTHYTLIKDGLTEALGKSVRVIAQDEILPKKLMSYLDKHSALEIKLTRGGSRKTHLTEYSEQYDRTIAGLLQGVYQSTGDE